MKDGQVFGEDDPYLQTVQCLLIIQMTIEEAGGKLEDVVRTRVFVIDIDDWEQIGKAHAQFFAEIRPAATMIKVSRLIDPKLLVEIEVDAYIS